MTKPEIAYEYGNALYLNITNRCPTACVFCIKRKWEMNYRGNDLNLRGREPDAGEIIASTEKKFSKKKYSELVFCGYGEPTLRFEVLKEVCGFIRKGLSLSIPSRIRIRVNTNGLGSLVNGRDITSEMKGLVDSVNISLNSADPVQWLKLMVPAPAWAEKGFESVLVFIEKAVASLPETVVTAVENQGVKLDEVEKLALAKGAKFRRRPVLDYEN